MTLSLMRQLSLCRSYEARRLILGISEKETHDQSTCCAQVVWLNVMLVGSAAAGADGVMVAESVHVGLEALAAP